MTRPPTRPGPAPTGGRLTGWLGATLARVRLNAVERRVGPGGLAVVAKRRYWFSPVLIAPGNLYLRWLRAGVVVLGDRQWQARERAIHRQLHGLDCATNPRGWLILPEWPGATLANFAADHRYAPADRLLALAAASRALQALHQVRIAWAGDPHGGIGHGDATLRNVQYDPLTRQAQWFDFDTMHLPGVPPLARRADDLRALLYSALAARVDLPVPDLVATVRAAYDDDRPWHHLRADLQRGPIHFSTFHLAQANPAVERRRQLEHLIRQKE